MRMFKNLLILLAFSLTLVGTVEAKYEIIADPLSVGSPPTKPEDGLAFSLLTTTKASKPCPDMTEVQRDALTPKVVGSCVYNTTTAVTEFWSGAIWNPAGSTAVLSEWATGSVYGIGSFVYTTPDYKLWIATTSHTAGATFAGDIANWDEASDDIDTIASSTDNGIVRFDGTGGGTVQNSLVTIDDSDNIITPGNMTSANLTVIGATTLQTTLNGFLRAISGVVTHTAQIDLASEVSGVLPIANGGSNSSTALTNDSIMYSQAGAIVESSLALDSSGNLSGIANLTATGTTTLDTALTGVAKLTAGVVSVADVDLTTEVTGVLPVANGGTGSATQNFVDLTTAQTVAGIKTFSSDGLWSGTGQLDLPVGTTAQRSGTPNSGMIRFNSDTVTFEGHNGSAWGEIGGGGGGGINYIPNSDIEIDSTGYTKYKDAAASTPVDGTGGTSTLLLSTTTVDNIMDTKSLKIVTIGSNHQGEGFSHDFTIDKGQQARKQIIRFMYNASHAGYADDDMSVYVYDVTNAKIIRISGEDLKGGEGEFIGQFQTAPDSLSYRLIFHVASTSTTSYEVIFDNISVGPQVITHGAIVTDWEDLNITTNNFPTTSITAKYKRNGDTLEGQIVMVLSGVPTGSMGFSLDDFTIDGDKLPENNSAVGAVSGYDTGSTQYTGTLLAQTGDNFIFTGGRATSTWSATQPYVWAATDTIRIEFTVPIVGWSSNLKQSEDFSGREISAKMYLSGNQTVSSIAVTPITFDVAAYNTAGMTNTGSNRIDIVETGNYHVCLNLNLGDANNGSVDNNYPRVRKNGATVIFNFGTNIVSASRWNLNGCADEYLIKGDYVDAIVDSTSDVSYIVYGAAAGTTYLSVTKLASPQTNLENELVAARYTSNSGQSIGTSATTLEYEDIDYDTHSAYNTTTGEYTVPVSGKYALVAAHLTANTAWTANNSLGLHFYVGVSPVSSTFIRMWVSTTTSSAIAISDTINLVKGDVVVVKADNQQSAAMGTASDYNYFSITKVK